MPEMMTLEQAETQLAELEAVYKKKGAALRAYIKVLKADETTEEGGDDDNNDAS